MSITRVVCFLCTIYFVCAHWRDFMGKQSKWNIIGLAHEITEDGLLKYNQTSDIRKEHGRSIAYEIGFIIGVIREKYKLMMEYYRVCTTRYRGDFKHHTPRLASFITVHYFRRQEMILLLETEIDRLVEVLEKIPLKMKPYPIHLESRLGGGADDHLVLRAREEDSEEEEKQQELEEAVKSRYREEFLMRKLNTTGQSTPKKRFIHKWPVPGTWSSEMY